MLSKLVVGREGDNDVLLPLDIQTKTTAVLGIRESGKTHTATVIAEQLLYAGRQVVVIDPTDAWWGLRSSADGRSPGCNIVVCGGDNGQVPLSAHDGGVLADFAVDEGCALVLSLRHLRKSDQRKFVIDFAEQTYHRKGESGKRTPLLVVIDECHLFVPQKVGGAEARMVGAIEDLVRNGRNAGIGVMLISQRAASVNKDVLTQLELMIAHRHTSPHDRKALGEWVEAHDTEGRWDEFMERLASLPRGVACFWSPGWLDMFAFVSVAQRRTFDSSATPTLGRQARVSIKMSETELAALRAKLAATIKQAEDNDPKRLKIEIARLQKELAAKIKVPTAIESVKFVERPVVKAAQLERIHKLLGSAEGVLAKLRESVAELKRALDSAGKLLPSEAPVRPPPLPAARLRVVEPPGDSGSRALRPSSGEYRMLQTLVSRHPVRLTESQWAVLSRLRRTGGTFATYKSRLRCAGLVESNGETWWASKSALDAYPEMVLSSRDNPIDEWKSKLGSGPAKMIDALHTPLSREELAERVGLTVDGGTFATYLSRLRSNGLVREEDGVLSLTEVLTV